MSRSGALLLGPWRAVLVLGVTQIIGWGALVYTVVLNVPLMAAERGWSISFGMSGFSLALLCAGFAAPTIGRMIDRFGGHAVMPFGTLLGAAGLIGLVYAAHPLIYLAVWAVIGLALAGSLYDPAFATLARIFGAEARRAITWLTLAGGFASTVSWPATHFLNNAIGWRGTYLVYAGLLALIATPLHAFALPRSRADPLYSHTHAKQALVKRITPSGWPFVLVVIAFAAFAFVPSAMGAHMLAIFARLGLDAGTVVAIGALFGPAQVAARLLELIFARNIHPLIIARIAVGLLLVAFAILAFVGLNVVTAATFAILFGMSNGLITIARGAVPLALFGPEGLGAVIGRISGPSLVIMAAAPLVLAFVAERVSDQAALAIVTVFASVAFIGFVLIKRPS